MKPSYDRIVELYNGKVISDTDERVQLMFKFNNNLGASVVWFKYYNDEIGIESGSYGYESSLWELAVVRFVNSPKKWEITYDYPKITSDVLGYLNEESVLKTLEKIRKVKV